VVAVTPREFSTLIKETVMTRTLIVVALILVAVIGLGFYLGYLQVGADSSDGVTRVTLTVDQNKIKGDEKKVVEKVQGRE
jgi:hypothetical protein